MGKPRYDLKGKKLKDVLHNGERIRPIAKPQHIPKEYRKVLLQGLAQSPLPEPVTAPYDDDRYILMEDYCYRGIWIPRGFLFDGASIPRLFWMIYTPFDPEHLLPALIHDFLYHRLVSREMADRLFKEVLKLKKNGKLKTSSMYRAVRLFGGSSYES